MFAAKYTLYPQTHAPNQKSIPEDLVVAPTPHSHRLSIYRHFVALDLMVMTVRSGGGGGNHSSTE